MVVVGMVEVEAEKWSRGWRMILEMLSMGGRAGGSYWAVLANLVQVVVGGIDFFPFSLMFFDLIWYRCKNSAGKYFFLFPVHGINDGSWIMG